MENPNCDSIVSGLASETGERAGDDRRRLNALIRAEAEMRATEQVYRRSKHESAAALMRRPVANEAAWAHFGLALGILPPAAIFYRMFDYGWRANELEEFGFFALLLLMNLVCAVAGLKCAACFSRQAFDLERRSWTRMLLLMPLLGALWGLLTGALGGALFFGIGAIGGIFCAVPTGIVAFSLFAIAHRWLERGGMIEQKHLLPLAWGISLTIAAFVIGI